MNSSAAPEVLENYHVFIDEYYNTLCHTLTTLCHQNLQPTRATLDAELKANELFGVIAGILLGRLALADEMDLPVPENTLKTYGRFRLSDRYKDVLKIKFPLYERWGWIKI